MYFAFFLNCAAKLRTFMIYRSVIAHKMTKKGLFNDLNQEKDKKRASEDAPFLYEIY